MLNKPIIISNWKKGMTLSPYSGFPQMRGLDPHKIDGVVSIGKAPVALTTMGTAVQRVNWTVYGNDTKVYFLDETGKLFITTDYVSYSQIQGTAYNAITESTNAHGNGLLFWKGHILRCRDGLLDAYKISNTTWYYGIVTLTYTNVGLNPMFVGQDDVVYIGNGNTITSIEAVGTFDASNSATWKLVNSVLTLPQDYAVSSFSELGNNLMIGTKFGVSPVFTRIADIFPWDRDTAHSFSLPIRIAEGGINAMETKNNLLYISAGYLGNLYVSNGVSVSLLNTVPLDTKQKTGSPSSLYLEVRNDAFDFLDEEIIIGVSQYSTGENKTENPIGVYGFLAGIVRFLGNGSYGKDGSDGTRIIISSILVIGPDEFFVSWSSGASYGIDYYGPANNMIGSYGSYCHTEIYSVGSERQKATLEFFDFYLSKPLVSGDGIRLSYRTSNSGSFTTIATLDFATHGAVDSFSFTKSLPNIKTIQFRIEMTATGTTTPELRMIIIS